MPVLPPSVRGLSRLYTSSAAASPLRQYQPYEPPQQPQQPPTPGPAPAPPPPPPAPVRARTLPIEPVQPVQARPQLEPVQPRVVDRTMPAPAPVPIPGRYSDEVERWRPLVSRHFRPEDVDKALYVISGESGGDPSIENREGSGAEGLFQILKSHGVNGKDPETAIRWAANQVYNARGNWGDWGEGVLYNGEPFGVLGVTPYGGGAPMRASSSAVASRNLGTGPLEAPVPVQAGVRSAVTARRDEQQPFGPELVYQREGFEPVGGASAAPDFGSVEPGLEAESAIGLSRQGERQPATVPVQGESDPYRLAVLTAFTQDLSPEEVDYALEAYESELGAGGAPQDAFKAFLDRRKALGEQGRIGGLLGGATTNAELIRRFGTDIALGFMFGGPVGAFGAVAGDIGSEVLEAGLPRSEDPYWSAVRKGLVLSPNFLTLQGKQGVAGRLGGKLPGLEPSLRSRAAAGLGASALGQGFEAAGIPEVPGVGNVGELIGGVAGGAAAGREVLRRGRGPVLGASPVGPDVTGQPRWQPATEGRELARTAGDFVPPENLVRFTAKNLPAEFRVMQNGKRAPGLPPGITTDAQAARRLNRILDAGLGAPGHRFWYETSGEDILNYHQGDVAQAELFARGAAISSMDAGVAAQAMFMLRGWQQFQNGQPLERAGRFGAVSRRIEDALKMSDADWDAQIIKDLQGGSGSEGMKLANFYLDIIDSIDPERAARLRAAGGATATVDRWGNRLYGYKNDTRTTPQYNFMGRGFVEAGRRLGWKGKHQQAATWVTKKAEEEGTSLSAAAFDLGDSLRRHTAQMSWETAPGRDTDLARILGDFDNWTPEEKLEWHDLATRATQDEQGRDIATRAYRLMTTGAVEGPGVWGQNVNPSTQRQMIAARQGDYPAPPGELKGLPGPEGITDPAQAERLSALAAFRAFVHFQEGVGWTKSFPTVAQGLRNGAEVDIGRPINRDEALRLSAAMEQLARNDPSSPTTWAKGFGRGWVILTTAQGAKMFRIPGPADFAARHKTPTDKITPATKEVKKAVADRNKRTKKLMEDAINLVWDNDTTVRLGTVATDGDLPMNDWSTNPHGENHLRRATADSPHLHGLALELQRRVRAAAGEISLKHLQRQEGLPSPATGAGGYGPGGAPFDAAPVGAYGTGAGQAPGIVRPTPLKQLGPRPPIDLEQYISPRPAP